MRADNLNEESAGRREMMIVLVGADLTLAAAEVVPVKGCASA